MNKLTVFLLMFSSTPPSTLTPTDTCLCKAILKLWYYYAMHIITIAFTCSQIKWCQFHLTSSVNMILSFLFLARLWENKSDLVCLCDSGTKIIPLWNAKLLQEVNKEIENCNSKTFLQQSLPDWCRWFRSNLDTNTFNGKKLDGPS